MAPVLRKREACMSSFNISIDRNSSATFGANNYQDEDKHALLYIVCTLLFYSLGMIIGIVSYIRREKQDSEQDRMFNEFLTSFRGKTEEIHYRQLKVQETVERLAVLERNGDIKEHSFGDLDIRTGNSNVDGKNVTDKSNLLKFSNLCLLRAPVVVVSSMTSEAGCKATNTDTESPDPFQDRRLSEVVAQMLESDIECATKEKYEHLDYCKNVKDFESGLIEYCKEPRNKDLHRETVHSMQELESDSILAVDNILVVDNTEVGQNTTGDDLATDNNETFYQNIETTYGTSVETVFGINVTEENGTNESEKKISNETDISLDIENENKRVKWSVTSV